MRGGFGAAATVDRAAVDVAVELPPSDSLESLSSNARTICDKSLAKPATCAANSLIDSNVGVGSCGFIKIIFSNLCGIIIIKST